MKSQSSLRQRDLKAVGSLTPSAPAADNPAADVRTEITEKFNSWQKFWRTRRSVFADLVIAKRSKSELESAALLSAWKFNLAQSVFSALPAFLLGKLIHFVIPPSEPHVDLTASMSLLQKAAALAVPLGNQVFDSLWPVMFPFVLFLMARMVAWGSIKRIHATTLRKEWARNAYLYLDGAYGFFPQMLAALGLTLGSLGGRSPLETLSGGGQDIPGNASGFLVVCQVVGIAAFGGALIWQGILNRWLLARKLFIFNGYSPKFKWFWMFRDKQRNFAPWNKYIFSLSYAIPVALIFIVASTATITFFVALGLSAFRLWISG